jgi:CRISPR-associated endonuclease/helicase Cas3
MKSMEMPVDSRYGRRDALLEVAFRGATENTIVTPNTLQRALFPRLSTQDTGLLVLTGPGAGRLEAVFVPVITGTDDENHLHRLYIIAPDNALLDDYIYRLSTYVRGVAVASSRSLTLFVDGDEQLCRKYFPDGSCSENLCNHPLDADVDVVVAHFSSFRSLFFGAGGVHALPGKLETVEEIDLRFELRRRDLFYFDEAQNYDPDEFVGFVKLVEFLYAEDLDVVVGSTTLPDSSLEELSFLDPLPVEEAQYQPPRSIVHVQATQPEEVDVMFELVTEKYFASSRVGIVRETPEQALLLFERLSPLYPNLVFCYRSDQAKSERMMTYAQIRELEKEGEGYLLICDGPAIESADVDVNLLITSLCAPEGLLRRAGRCNRRGDLTMGEIIVVGSSYSGRTLPETRLRHYVEFLESLSKAADLIPSKLKSFIA